jgi:hypothetical protein
MIGSGNSMVFKSIFINAPEKEGLAISANR